MGEIAQDMINGLCCCQCGIYFEAEHGYPVLCVTCHGDQDEGDIPKTTEKEL